MGKKGSGPIKFTKMKLKLPGARGTKQSADIVEALQENWTHVKEKYRSMKADEQEELMDHFNSAIDNLGDILFGEDSEADELKTLVDALSDEKCKEFVTAVKEGMILEDP